MGRETEVSGKILGQISLMQSVVAQLPDQVSILKFVSQGCRDIPGVETVEYSIYEAENKIAEPEPGPKGSFHHFSITHKGHTHARLSFKLLDPDAFFPYIPFLENFSNMLAIIFEEKNQRQLNRTILATLEKKIYERTQALEKEIGERKLTEAALRQSETYLETLIRTIPDLIWLKDKNGIYLYCNPKFERMFGAKKENIIGKTDYDFVDRDLADFFRMHDKEAMAKGGPSVNEEEVSYADDGHHEILETIKTPMYDSNGQLIGVLGIARDITERKNAEEERKKLESQLRQSHKMEAIGMMAGGIAHDFNNIIGIIIGNTELAMDDIEEWDPARINLEEIEKACLRAGDITKQLLNFTRKTEQTKKIINIHSLVKESIKLLRSSIPTSIDIQVALPEHLSTIVADPTQVHQVLINLCTNAAHSMEKEGGTLKIELSEIELDRVTATPFQTVDAGRYVQLAISDTGQGIDPAIKANIFDPYFTTKEVGKGTGMGLAVVMGIVKNHKGAISVKSEPGQGSVFSVLFPAVEGQEFQDGSLSEELPGGTETILFIDDEQALVDIGRTILQRLGYRVETRTDPVQALELIRSDPAGFDLVITDVTMPHVSGDQLVREILKINPAMTIILCTGLTNRIDREQALKIGAKCFIEKPFDKHKLSHSVRTALDG